MGEFGDRMKAYERQEAGRRLLPLLPICARIDGKGFSKFTKDLERPYDPRMSELMSQTVTYLTQETQACIGYTQSDEISLVWYSPDVKNRVFFDRRIQKMVSILASMTTAFFNSRLSDLLPEKKDKLAMFDCRVWQVPTLEEAANVFLWREYDATKNSISMAARHYYPQKLLHKKTGNGMTKMLLAKGIDWDDYPPFFKRGVFVQKRKVMRTFTTDELNALPEKHKARQTPDLQVERTEYKRIAMPAFGCVTNRVGVIFNGEDPLEAKNKETSR